MLKHKQPQLVPLPCMDEHAYALNMPERQDAKQQPQKAGDIPCPQLRAIKPNQSMSTALFAQDNL
ncbi:MAG: hypothetical protein UU06_C0018G0006 [Parcubacteria group bacterium GW2011_GWB1_40_5]|nr:MAG: hypothetical protein UU06_C0018G0006 [Parcubacteria group bacterium GW2011_GWB1_40_5]